MPVYRRGSKGPEVVKLQERLRQLGLYSGPIDGGFGGGTESAVWRFQEAEGITADGEVGPQTWGRLFASEPAPVPSMVGQPLGYRSLALTASFETNNPPPECFAGLSGDFDRQGISFGVLQWNIGQRSLQPLLSEVDRSAPGLFEEVFHAQAGTLRAVLAASFKEQMDWARSIQTPGFRLIEPWHGLFKTLGRRKECQDVQVRFARRLHTRALQMVQDYGLRSQRAVALMFDILVQNGSISSIVRQQILADAGRLPASMPAPEAEVERMKIVANRRAEAAKAQWVADVRVRKLTIATGHGVVHGNHYDLENDYGLGLEPAFEV